MTDHVYEAMDGLRRHHEQHTREVAAELVMTIAAALYVAAVVLFLLMLVVWDLSGGSSSDRDFPGQYWLAELPTLAGAVTLTAAAGRVRRGRFGA